MRALLALLLLPTAAATFEPSPVADPPGDTDPPAAAAWADLLRVTLAPLEDGAWQAQIQLATLASAPPRTWHLLLFEGRGESFYVGAFWDAEGPVFRAGQWDPHRMVPVSGEAMAGTLHRGAPAWINVTLPPGFPRSPLEHHDLRGLVLDDTPRAILPELPPSKLDETASTETYTLPEEARQIPYTSIMSIMVLAIAAFCKRPRRGGRP